MQLGEWVRTARERLELNQTDFGDKFGVTKQAVSHWETGRNECSVTQFLRIGQAAKMDPSELDQWPSEFRVLTGPTHDSSGGSMNGWPLSPELLAALQNTDPQKREFIENTARLALGLAITQRDSRANGRRNGVSARIVEFPMSKRQESSRKRVVKSTQNSCRVLLLRPV